MNLASPDNTDNPDNTDLAAIDQWLDGECAPAGAAAFEQAVRENAHLASRVAERKRYLERLRNAGAAYREHVARDMPAHVDARVRLALSGRRSRRVRWMPLAAAATVLLAVGAFFWTRGTEQAEAVPAAILRAVDYAALEPESRGMTCATEDEQVARQSELVQMGDYNVADCNGDASEPSARLARVEDLPVVGWAATRATKEVRGPEMGMTVLKNFVVFDVARGRQREYLAVARKLYDVLEKRHPGRASCAVCHNRSRDGQDNPHDIKLRRWK